MWRGIFKLGQERPEGEDDDYEQDNIPAPQARSLEREIQGESHGGRVVGSVRANLNDEMQPHAAHHNPRASTGGFQFFGGRAAAQADVEMERKVSNAAKRLGQDVQRIVVEARMGGQNRQNANENHAAPIEWRVQLLDLLGGSDLEIDNGNDHSTQSHSSDIDILLENSSCSRFVLRCVEHDLPPNLIHCLRLLRVLELQHAHAAAAVNQRSGGRPDSTLSSMSKFATEKVSNLLCLLCTDPIVGKQLKPHLFGLLAMSGASYPPNGVHVGSAASDVIVSFSQSCLSHSLVMFLHEREMICHMTDDVKELCGMTEIAQPASATLCLYGQAAEEAGLWLVALKTIVHLVTNSCNYHCIDLLRDFDTSGGYHVLCYSIVNSEPEHIKKLLELVIILACCNTEVSDIDDMSIATDQLSTQQSTDRETNINDSHLVTNPNAIAIIADLMVRSVPFLIKYAQDNNNSIPSCEPEHLGSHIDTALEQCLENHSKSGKEEGARADFDMARELLVCTLQIYSDHANNYSIIESEYHILSRYLISFPTFQDIHTKFLVLRLLEYVCTGLPDSDFSIPLRVASELFFNYCIVAFSHLDSSDSDLISILGADIMLLCGTFEKLLQFDESVSRMMVDGNFINTRVSEILKRVQTAFSVSSNISENQNYSSELPPPKKTLADETYSALCRVLKLFGPNAMSQLILSSDDFMNGIHQGDIVETKYSHDIIMLLNTGVSKLGRTASDAAIMVLEAKMAACKDEVLEFDMEKVFGLLDTISLLVGKSLGVNLSLSKHSNKKNRVGSGSGRSDHQDKKSPPSDEYIYRLLKILLMLKNVLETNERAQDVFRNCYGFEYLIKMLYCFEGSALTEGITTDNQSIEQKIDLDLINYEAINSIKTLVETSCGVISAATKPCSKNPHNLSEVNTATKSIDMLSESDIPQSPSAMNQRYIRDKGFYINFASVISGTGILNSYTHARDIINEAFKLMDPKLHLPATSDDDEDYETLTYKQTQNSKTVKDLRIQNPDASRLALGISIFLPNTESGKTLGRRVLDELLRLCGIENAGTSLSQIASSKICVSLTNATEFAIMLEDTNHHLHSRFILLMRRIAAFNMSYVDFISLLRCVAGPVLLAGFDDVNIDSTTTSVTKIRKVRLPVITSTISTSKSRPIDSVKNNLWHARESSLCNRLTLLSDIAERGDRVARCLMGGDSLNTVALYMQKVKVKQRLYSLAEQGRVKFLEVESIDAAAMVPTSLNNTSNSGNPSTAATAEKIWTPLSSSGFTFSIWLRLPEGGYDVPGNIFILDLSSPLSDNGGGLARIGFLSVWYDILSQRFNVLTSGSNKPTSFPTSPLASRVWHHILLTFQAPKRTMLSRKSVLSMCVDGRPLEADIKADVVSLPPTSRMLIGVPNPELASSGIIRGQLPVWELGSTLLLSTLLTPRNATSIYAAGPDFNGLFWGDRPQRFSLAATATATFAMLAESGEQGSVAGALRRRGVPEVEAAGHVNRDRNNSGDKLSVTDSDSLLGGGLLCKVSPEFFVCALNASASSNSMCDGSSSSNRRHYSRRLVNVARINFNGLVSTDAVIYGYGSIISPHCFADNIQWVGGPSVLLPIVNAARSTMTMALALRLIRESVHRHPPNLEMLQAGGGYRILGLLLRQNKMMDEYVLDQCFAFAVHGFVPDSMKSEKQAIQTRDKSHAFSFSDRWVFTDLDAMKFLLLNHQVWDLRGSGPSLPLRLLSFLNGLVASNSVHAAFNSRRLHLLGIIRWTLHLMLEAAELYALGTDVMLTGNAGDTFDEDQRLHDVSAVSVSAYKSGWYVTPPSVANTAVGDDPGNSLLLGCKTLLRRVLTYMLTPIDLESIANATVYTVSIDIHCCGDNDMSANSNPLEQNVFGTEEKLMPGAVARVYLVRLLEELVVDGVNEIVTASTEKSDQNDKDASQESQTQPHSGGGTCQNHMSMMVRRRNDPNSDGVDLADHRQAQAFLSAFAGMLTPVWFACILEGCRDEASASAVFRLMILMLQSSPAFSRQFEEAGGFAPLVLSIPKFSTCASIITSMLSQLMNAPILHLPCFGSLDPAQLCEFFDVESDSTELTLNENMHGGLNSSSDPSCGVFALLAECIGRNIQLATCDTELGIKAKVTNDAILNLLSHRHTFSSAFQDFCRTPDFLEPLAQALCLVHDERLQEVLVGGSISGSDELIDDDNLETNSNFGHNSEPSLEDFIDWPTEKRDEGPAIKKMPRSQARRGSLSSVHTDQTATERFVERVQEDAESSGVGMIQLLKLVLSHSVLSGSLAAPLVAALFRSFPIHASPDQVEAFHLVLIEHCNSVIEDALQRGEQLALANCVGISSVLLDRLMAGFFTSEPILEAVKIILSTLSRLSTTGTYASRTLGTTEQNMLVADAAHLARLTCLSALVRSRPMGPFDKGDDDLKLSVLDNICRNLRQLLLVAQPDNATSVRRSGGVYFPSPPTGTKLHQIWQSASLTRCIESCTYPDYENVEEPEKAFILALMAELHAMLSDQRNDIRIQAVSTIISLLQQRKGIMSELLITEIRNDGRIETVDLINRGGFSSLYVQLEATPLAENQSTDFIKKKYHRGTVSSGSQIMYEQFFEWFERNNSQVSAVFHDIHLKASRLFPTMDNGASTPEEAILNEQKRILLKLTLQNCPDKTILGGLERAELAQRSHDKTAESHALWKRQGFDDLSSGAMKWKFLLRQLKGSCSIWEGGLANEEESPFSVNSILAAFEKHQSIDNSKPGKVTLIKDIDQTKEKSVKKSDEIVTRWKLDLTEGYERQRRRLLPNYEFHGLYNLDEAIDEENDDNKRSDIEEDNEGPLESPSSDQKSQLLPKQKSRRLSMIELTTQGMEATAQLLKDMQLGKTQMNEDDDFDPEDRDYIDDVGEENDFENAEVSTEQELGREFSTKNESTTSYSGNKDIPGKELDMSSGYDKTAEEQNAASKDSNARDNILASSYELITGLLHPGEYYEKSYNVKRCTGLEVRQALLLWCQNSLYVIDGFEKTDGEGLEGQINRLEKSISTYNINLRPQDFTSTDHCEEDIDGGTSLQHNDGKVTSDKQKSKELSGQSSSEEITYQHRSQRIAFRDIYSVYRRRYQLQQNALEIYDIHRNGTLIAFSSHYDREEVLSKVLNSPLPSSIFSSNALGGGTSINYKKFMNTLRAKITNQWLQGKITNFDFIMHLNSFAGRTYNDLTQYPVFPWIIADYESEELDFDDPKTFRDLSKPMGAQSEARAQQFRDRFEALEENYHNEDEPPPFHYGTHYSCAAYVLYYLMRLEPFSRLALSLQGGRFDVADRLFHNIGSSWKSASSENLQDVRELIPEFFYLPQFLVNSNMFDFGTTQQGKTVHHVTLPKWAKGDPKRFIRLNRMALESEYVSRNLHKWVDLVFGYKQRGREAVNALNTFVHVTYEGSVDLDSITDPIQRESIIAQIQNFGQTPSRLERKPFPPRNVMVALKGDSIDFSSLAYLSHLTPSFCVVGAPHRSYLRCVTWENCKVGIVGQPDSAVGDICLVRGQLLGVGKTCALIMPAKKYYRYGGPNNGVSVHVAATVGAKVNRVVSIHDGMHRAPITFLKPSLNGMWVVTGCMDSTVRVWKYEGDTLQLQATLCGHEGGKITCIDISTRFGQIITGGADGNILLWDLRTLTFLRKLTYKETYGTKVRFKTAQPTPAISVSCNHRNGNVLSLVGLSLKVFDINGNIIATAPTLEKCTRNTRPSCAISTGCPEWMEHGIAVVTGHVNGDIKLWSINYEEELLILRHTVQKGIHSCPITCLRIVDEREDTLLVGDVSGKMSVWKTLQLESLKPEELGPIIQELRNGMSSKDDKVSVDSSQNENTEKTIQVIAN